jgi:hypothetical protein
MKARFDDWGRGTSPSNQDYTVCSETLTKNDKRCDIELRAEGEYYVTSVTTGKVGGVMRTEAIRENSYTGARNNFRKWVEEKKSKGWKIREDLTLLATLQEALQEAYNRNPIPVGDLPVVEPTTETKPKKKPTKPRVKKPQVEKPEPPRLDRNIIFDL